jgi:hypothetical protein
MSFDLNLDNYQINELEEIFELPSSYDKSLIEKKNIELQKSVMNDGKMDSIIKKNTIDFLIQAKNKILNTFKNQNGPVVKAIKQVFNVNDNLVPSEVISPNGSNFVIEHPRTTYTQSLPSEYVPGIINPLKKRITKEYLNIDTRFRTNYYSSSASNFHFDLPEKYSNVVSMQLNSIELPTTYFVISKQLGNNYFKITFDTSEESTMITIPTGNYTSQSLVDYLNYYVQLGVLSTSNFKVLLFTLNEDITKSGTGQIIVGINEQLVPDITDDSYNFTLGFDTDANGYTDNGTPLPLKFGWLMGFRLGTYSGNCTYVTEGIPDLKGSKYLFLVIDDYNNNVNDSFSSAFNSSILNKNILARISYAQNTFNIVSQNNLGLITPKREYYGPVDVQKMNVQLLDEYGRIVELNNMDFSFCITFQMVYDL